MRVIFDLNRSLHVAKIPPDVKDIGQPRPHRERFGAVMR